MAQVKAHRQAFIDLQTGCGTLRDQLQSTLQQMDARLQMMQNQLQQALEMARDEVRYAENDYYDCQNQASDSDDDNKPDCHQEQQRIYQAQTRLDALSYQWHQFNAEMNRYQQATSAVWHLIHHTLPHAQSELGQREQLINRLWHLGEVSSQMASYGTFTSTSSASQRYIPTRPSPSSTAWVNKGVVWVSLSALPEIEGIDSEADFKKVSLPMMESGLAKLQEMANGDIHDGDYWSQVDANKNLSYEHGYRRIYDAFWGGDAIKLDKDGDKYTVINGRHRIWLARRMGISRLPAQVTEKSG